MCVFFFVSFSAPQAALTEAAAWFNLYTTLTEKSCTYGFGQSKKDEGFFTVFGPEDLSGPVDSLSLATYLHDDPTYFRNNQLDV